MLLCYYVVAECVPRECVRGCNLICKILLIKVKFACALVALAIKIMLRSVHTSYTYDSSR